MGITFSVFDGGYGGYGYRSGGDNPLVAGLISSVMGSALVIAGIAFIRDRAEYTNGTTGTVKAVGTVGCGTVTLNGGRTASVCPATVEYSVSGKKYSRELRLADAYVGKNVKLIYDPKDPANAWEGNALLNKLGGPAFICGGLLLVLIALLIAFLPGSTREY